MTEQPNLQNRLVVGRKRDGRREFDEAARQELVELCLKPDVPLFLTPSRRLLRRERQLADLEQPLRECDPTVRRRPQGLAAL